VEAVNANLNRLGRSCSRYGRRVRRLIIVSLTSYSSRQNVTPGDAELQVARSNGEARTNRTKGGISGTLLGRLLVMFSKRGLHLRNTGALEVSRDAPQHLDCPGYPVRALRRDAIRRDATYLSG
jgi:hypothetical protein